MTNDQWVNGGKVNVGLWCVVGGQWSIVSSQ